MPGTLYLVATPIGNMEDLSPRAARVLGQVSTVAAEDTRVTRRLLEKLGARPRLLSCHEHNERQRAEQIAAELTDGDDVALVSDAGSPGISDPGYPVVRAAVAAGAQVVAVPGPCAALLALQISGLPTDRFSFYGFAPKKTGRRRTFLREVLSGPGTGVLYVPARDTAAVLDDLCALSPRPPDVAAARELTKLHEEVLRGPADRVRDEIQTRTGGSAGVWKGEVTLVVARPQVDPADLTDDDLLAELRAALAEGLDKKAALRQVRDRTSVPRKRLYTLLERNGDG